MKLGCALVMLLSAWTTGCQPPQEKEMDHTAPHTFSSDKEFLSRFDSTLVALKLQDDGPQVLVSPKYQAKVFTSGLYEDAEMSFGWINYDAITSAKRDLHMNAYGGESRMWIGPEGGQYAIFFAPETQFSFENWKTPPAIDYEAWEIGSRTDSDVVMRKDARFTNHSGYTFHTVLSRRIGILSGEQIFARLEVEAPGEIKVVGYETINTLTNTGKESWRKESGGLCIWILDMFPPSDSTVVIIPYRQESSYQAIVRSDYFGEIPEERLQVRDGIIMFRADGKERGKLGIPPLRATSLAASIDLVNNVLTITQFDLDTAGLYMNQEWRLHENPYDGDAINSYNDGPLGDGGQLGPFYELESVSPAAFLAPGESLAYTHSVYHFAGDQDRIETLLGRLFGLQIREIENFLTNQ
jgi:hypothetical protein